MVEAALVWSAFMAILALIYAWFNKLVLDVNNPNNVHAVEAWVTVILKYGNNPNNVNSKY